MLKWGGVQDMMGRVQVEICIPSCARKPQEVSICKNEKREALPPFMNASLMDVTSCRTICTLRQCSSLNHQPATCNGKTKKLLCFYRGIQIYGETTTLGLMVWISNRKAESGKEIEQGQISGSSISGQVYVQMFRWKDSQNATLGTYRPRPAYGPNVDKPPLSSCFNAFVLYQITRSYWNSVVPAYQILPASWHRPAAASGATGSRRMKV